jgi:hypothetical protein
MRNGTFDWTQSPLSVVVHGGTTYVVDGHHRLAAARLANLEQVSVDNVTATLLERGFLGYRDMDDVIRSAGEFMGNRLNQFKLR